ncbi:hypothetical protein ACFLYA_02985 [Candidatus Dependentiae bacterium]
MFFSMLSNSFSVFGMRENREYFHPKGKKKKTVEKIKLLDLPTEILEYEIFPCWDDQKTKINVSMACEEMREAFYKNNKNKIFLWQSYLKSPKKVKLLVEDIIRKYKKYGIVEVFFQHGVEGQNKTIDDLCVVLKKDVDATKNLIIRGFGDYVFLSISGAADLFFLCCFISGIISQFKPELFPSGIPMEKDLLFCSGCFSVIFSLPCFFCCYDCYECFRVKKTKRIIDRLKVSSQLKEENEAESKKNK